MSYIGISDAFDGGNIDFVEYSGDDGMTKIVLSIKSDPFTQLEDKHHFQYFSFRSTVSGIEDGASVFVNYVIENAGESSYPHAWKDFTIFASSKLNDPDSWVRALDTTYDEGQLSWVHKHTANGSIYFAYFPPYSYERHLSLISQCEEMPDATVLSLGQTLDGKEMECISVGTGPRVCWIIHRQHPGESMAEFFAEGLLNRILGLKTDGATDGLVHSVLKMYTFYIVPNMNPDGASAGFLRTNACGANLNREWASTGKTGEDEEVYDAPSIERSPEVYHVLQKMDETGVDVFLDVHGDEDLPFNFIAGAEGNHNWGPRLESLHGAFLAAYVRANPDMQQEVGYDPAADGAARMNTATHQVSSLFDCLAMTLEMPFKDCMSNPDPVRGWSPARARMLGASVLDPLAYVFPHLRAETEFWKDFPERDKYIRPSSQFLRSPGSF